VAAGEARGGRLGIFTGPDGGVKGVGLSQGARRLNGLEVPENLGDGRWWGWPMGWRWGWTASGVGGELESGDRRVDAEFSGPGLTAG
jgi:hypothetical protein